MKLWLLRADYEIIVIRADTEADARMFAKKYIEFAEGDEMGKSYLDPKQTRCTELTVDGEPGIIDLHGG